MWLHWVAGVFLLTAGAMSVVRFVRSKNKGHLFVAACFLVAGGIFIYLAMS